MEKFIQDICNYVFMKEREKNNRRMRNNPSTDQFNGMKSYQTMEDVIPALER